ncbi:DUF262 domain-containing protein [Planctomycetota bacterium]|nr:DUF262 domain-containing protein [Planctomycetota bacterium]
MNIDADYLPIADFFGRTKVNQLIVPEYQREYVWESKHVNLLLDDLNEAFQADPDSEYFVGMAVCAPAYGENYSELDLEIIDGQQRTTFFVILIQIFLYRLERLKNSNPEELETIIDDLATELKFLVERNQGQPLLRIQYIRETEQDVFADMRSIRFDLEKSYKDLNANNQTSKSYKKIVATYHACGQSVGAMPREDFYSFAAWVIRKVKFVKLQATVTEALRIFADINAKGKGLTGPDLIKNFIFSSSERSLFKEINKHWKLMIDALPDEKTVTPFIRAFIIDRSEEVKDWASSPRTNELYEWFRKEENYNSLLGDSNEVDLVKDMVKGAKQYSCILEGRYSDGRTNDDLKAFTDVFSSSKQFYPLLYSTRSSEQAFKEAVSLSEKITVIQSVIGFKGSELEAKYVEWAISARDNQEQLNPASDMQRFIEEKSSDFLARFMALSYMDPNIKYYVAKLAEYVTRIVDKIDLGGFSFFYKSKAANGVSGTAIEHILPKSVLPKYNDGNYLDKRDLHPTFEGTFAASEEEIERLVENIGNLTLLTVPENSSAGDMPYSGKTSVYANSTFALTKHCLGSPLVASSASGKRLDNLGLTYFEEWTKETIADRATQLQSLAKKIWT